MNTAQRKKLHRSVERATPPSDSLPLLLARAVLRGVLCATGVVLVLSLVAAAVAYAGANPDRLITPLGLAVLAVAALICGMVTRRAARRSPLLCGSLGGLALLCVWFSLSCLLPDDLRGSFPTGVGWGLRGGTLFFSLLGASMGANLPKKRRRRSRI